MGTGTGSEETTRCETQRGCGVPGAAGGRGMGMQRRGQVEARAGMKVGQGETVGRLWGDCGGACGTVKELWASQSSVSWVVKS